MIGIIIITHTDFGEKLLSSVEYIIGKQDYAVSVSIDPSDALEQIKRRILNELSKFPENCEFLFFTDMPGGTPTNVSLGLIREIKNKFAVVSGLNMYMLISAFNEREKIKLDELVEKVIDDGKKSIQDIKKLFVKKCQ